MYFRASGPIHSLKTTNAFTQSPRENNQEASKRSKFSSSPILTEERKEREENNNNNNDNGVNLKPKFLGGSLFGGLLFLLGSSVLSAEEEQQVINETKEGEEEEEQQEEKKEEKLQNESGEQKNGEESEKVKAENEGEEEQQIEVQNIDTEKDERDRIIDAIEAEHDVEMRKLREEMDIKLEIRKEEIAYQLARERRLRLQQEETKANEEKRAIIEHHNHEVMSEVDKINKRVNLFEEQGQHYFEIYRKHFEREVFINTTPMVLRQIMKQRDEFMRQTQEFHGSVELLRNAMKLQSEDRVCIQSYLQINSLYHSLECKIFSHHPFRTELESFKAVLLENCKSCGGNPATSLLLNHFPSHIVEFGLPSDGDLINEFMQITQKYIHSIEAEGGDNRDDKANNNSNSNSNGSSINSLIGDLSIIPKNFMKALSNINSINDSYKNASKEFIKQMESLVKQLHFDEAVEGLRDSSMFDYYNSWISKIEDRTKTLNTLQSLCSSI